MRVHPRVWRHRDHVMSADDHVLAAILAMPPDARLTGISRIQQLGLDFGPRSPVRFVVGRDLHLDLDGVFLHRTVLMPPLDEVSGAPVAAFVAYCARARVIDAIKVGDWLLANGHMEWDELYRFALDNLWRDGAHEALWVLPHLDGDSRSLPESETRALLTFAGMPAPEVNKGAASAADASRIGDLVYRQWGLVVDYEGEHHQLDRAQYVKDIDRYASLRQEAVPYVQVTKESFRDRAAWSWRFTRHSSLWGTTARHRSSASGGASCSHASPTWLQRTGGGPGPVRCDQTGPDSPPSRTIRPSLTATPRNPASVRT